MRFVHALAAAVALALALPLGAAAQSGDDKGYRSLDEVQPTSEGTVEVVEFFSYACKHCFDFRPLLKEWHESTGAGHKLVHVPVVFGRDSWELLARAFYVAKSLDVVDRTHAAVFEALHLQGRRLNSEEAIADLYAEQGVDRQAVMDAFGSFIVDMKVKRAQRMVKDYDIRSTPSLAVAGRYIVDVRSAGGQSAMLNTLDRLITQQVKR